ncbi:MAG: prepilin-type N-terminal cleavage/methylation domain-containing protein [Desulfobacula sp.]|nr:prepilin-type N-terminal cleavage/methylation domain-containing protein [Desulfobacula sp.]
MAILKTSQGFTLIEIMLAILIFGIVITTVMGSFNFVFSSIDVIDENIVAHEMAKSCMNRMAADLTAIHVTPRLKYTPSGHTGASDPDPYRFEGENEETQEGRFSTLRFTSHTHLPIGNTMPGGIAEIVYYVMDDGEGHHYLFRSDRIFFEDPLEESGQDPVLCEKIKSLSFTYIDQEGEEHESWNSENDEFDYSTPKAVDIRLEIGDESASFFFNTMVPLPVFREKIEDKG